MAKINSRLKSVFTSFNLLFSIVGILILVLGFFNDTWRHTDQSLELAHEIGLLLLYMVGTVIMMISLLGAYGAHYESKVALVMFLVCMITSSIATLSTGISTAVARPQLVDVEQMEEVFKTAVPLDQTDQRTKDLVNSMEKTLHCCGLFSYNDWQNQIPTSCKCNAEMEERCKTVRYGQVPKTIYSQPCFPVMVSYLNVFFDYFLGVTFTLAIVAVLGMVLSSAMIHQMRDFTKPAVVLKVPAVFTPKLPKYQELFNTP